MSMNAAARSSAVAPNNSVVPASSRRERSVDHIDNMEHPYGTNSNVDPAVVLAASIAEHLIHTNGDNNGGRQPRVPVRKRTRVDDESGKNGTSTYDRNGKLTYYNGGSQHTEKMTENHFHGAAATETWVDSCATILASIDRRAYSRTLLRDANTLLERVVLPMSIPWTQAGASVGQMIDRDIDDLCETLIHDPFESDKQFEAVENSNTKAVVRRSRDPGCVEITVLTRPSMTGPLTQRPSHSSCLQREFPFAQDELSLQAFLEAHARNQDQDKRDNTSYLKSMLVSFNFASTSSRSTLFNTDDKRRRPLLLGATFQGEIQLGTRTTKTNATEIARRLGSYDCRSGLPSEPEGVTRFRAGRNRKVWMKKRPYSSVPVSILTGEHLGSGLWKRPREVTVGVRLNGSLLSTRTRTRKSASSFATNESEASATYDEKEVTNAIDAACRYQGPIMDWPSQCRLEVGSFLAGSLKGGSSNSNNFSPKLVTVDIANPFGFNTLSVLLPVLNCFPAEAGRIHTVCFDGGTIAFADGSSDPVTALLDAASSDKNICSICWDPNGVDGKLGCADIQRCEGCALVVHSACYGVINPKRRWKCDACRKFEPTCPDEYASKFTLIQHRRLISCQMCNMAGSSLMRDDKGGFVHNVCSFWNQPKAVPVTRPCALCSKTSQSLVRCAAKDCHVEFHPLCALIASTAADVHFQRTKRPPATFDHDGDVINRDIFLCTQFRLATLEVGSRVSDSLETIPIAFCGLHNNERRDDLYGLPAGGNYLRGAMQIPPRND